MSMTEGQPNDGGGSRFELGLLGNHPWRVGSNPTPSARGELRWAHSPRFTAPGLESRAPSRTINAAARLPRTRAVGRAAECTGLENRITCERDGGSNPSQPANFGQRRPTISLTTRRREAHAFERGSMTSKPCTALAFLVRIQVELFKFLCASIAQAGRAADF